MNTQLLLKSRYWLGLLLALLTQYATAQVVISQIYGGGGNSGATYTHDFIELFNRGTTPVDLTGWSVQYTSSTGTSWQRTLLSGSIPAGGYYLVQELQGAAGSVSLPTPDVMGTIGMSATSGKVALLNQQTLLTGSCPVGGSAVIDFVGYGTANCAEGGVPSPAPSNTMAVLRAASGCTDSDNNAADFTPDTPNPRNASTARHPCFSPLISVTPASLTLLNSTQLPGSNAVSYTVSATGLTSSDFRITVPSPFMVSAANAQSYPSGITLPVNSNGTVEPTTVTVALVSSSPGTFTASIANSSGSTTTTVALSGTTVSPSLSVSPTALTAFTTTVGTPSAVQTYTLTALSQTGGFATAPAGVEIRTGNNPFSASLTIPSSLSTISLAVDVRLTGAIAGPIAASITHQLNNSSNQSIASVAVSGAVVAPVVPQITVTPSSLTVVDYSENAGSFPVSYTVSASGLTADLTVTPPPNYLVSVGGTYGSSLSIPAINGAVPPTAVSVALVSSSPGTFAGVIINRSASTTATVAISGTALTQSVTVSPTALSNFSTTVGTPSASQSYTVTTQGGLPVYISAPSGFELRTGTGPFSSSLIIGPSLSVVTTPIEVHLTGALAGPVSGTIAQTTYYHASQGQYPVVVSGVVSASSTSPTLVVLHRDADYGNTQNNIIKPYLELRNDGNQPIPYRELTLRYWFTSEGQAPPTNLAVYYAQLGTVNMRYVALPQPRQGAYGYVEYSFPGGSSLAGGGNSGPIENGIQKTDGSNFDESDDYSYQANYQDYLPNPRITAYRNGTIIWGQEPTAVQSQTAVQVYTQAKDGTTTSQIQTRLELRNTGNVALAIQDVRIRYYFTSDNNQPASVYVDYADIGASNIQARVIKLPAPVGGADSYVELRTVPTSQSLAASSSLGAVDFRLVRSDYGLFDQSNDYSFAPNYGNLGLNNRVTVLLNNRLIFGTPPTGAPARAITQEATSMLKARLLGNPVVGSNAEVEITGASGQAVRLKLVDLQGRAVHEQRIEQAVDTERVSLPLGSNRGQLLLEVSTDSQQQSLKLLRP